MNDSPRRPAAFRGLFRVSLGAVYLDRRARRRAGLSRVYTGGCRLGRLPVPRHQRHNRAMITVCGSPPMMAAFGSAMRPSPPHALHSAPGLRLVSLMPGPHDLPTTVAGGTVYVLRAAGAFHRDGACALTSGAVVYLPAIGCFGHVRSLAASRA